MGWGREGKEGGERSRKQGRKGGRDGWREGGKRGRTEGETGHMQIGFKRPSNVRVHCARQRLLQRQDLAHGAGVGVVGGDSLLGVCVCAHPWA